MIDFANVLFAALSVGAMFGVFNPAGLDASFYVALHQQGIRKLNTAMPALGAATILLTLAAAVLGRDDSTRFIFLIGAVVCFAAAALTTRFLNQPINAIVMTWSAHLHAASSSTKPHAFSNFMGTYFSSMFLRATPSARLNSHIPAA